jgi:hypothetical protein
MPDTMDVLDECITQCSPVAEQLILTKCIAENRRLATSRYTAASRTPEPCCVGVAVNGQKRGDEPARVGLVHEPTALALVEDRAKAGATSRWV